MSTIWTVLTRRKNLDPISVTESRLARVLTTFDLTALGVGSTLGVGVYVLAGKVAKDSAGPAVILSFLIAAIASAFAGLCYAEFGARVPRAGSAYIYSYVCVGEFIAFIIGWNLILEYIIGSASVARGFSLYLDTLLNNTLRHTFTEIAPIDIPYMSSYFDFLGFTASILLAVGLAFGLKESSLANNIFTALNVFVVIFIVIAGSIKSDIKNWELPAPQNVTNGGSGGFFPFGVSGVMKGAATCFYGFVGFDAIATTGEEVKNPQRAIPFAIILSLIIVFLSYFGTSTVVTLMLPYYLQDVDAPIPHAFGELGWETAKWIVAIGGMFGLCASLFGAMFPLPRIIYAMASDGLVFKFLGTVNDRFSSPVIGTLMAGLLTGLMAAMFELDQLVNMMSIGTLLAYTIVSACVLLLRYVVDEEVNYSLVRTSSSESDMHVESASSFDNEQINTVSSDENDLVVLDEKLSTSTLFNQIFNYKKLSVPTKVTEKLVAVEIFIYCILCILLGIGAIYLPDPISHGKVWAIVLISLVGCLAILVLMSLGLQPHSTKKLAFKVPLVPLIPALSILVNIYLMLMLDTSTWIRFGVWMTLGIPIYFYSVRHYPKAQNNKLTIVVNGTKLNGAINHAFNKKEESDATNYVLQLNGNAQKLRKKAPSPPQILTPPDDDLVNQMEENRFLTEEVVLADLDTIILKEEQNSKLDLFDRTVSLDTVSSSSNAFYEENVVAIVHCEDVSSLPTTPHAEVPYSIPECNEEVLEDDNTNGNSNEEILNNSFDISDKSKEENVETSNEKLMEKEVSVEMADQTVNTPLLHQENIVSSSIEAFSKLEDTAELAEDKVNSSVKSSLKPENSTEFTEDAISLISEDSIELTKKVDSKELTEETVKTVNCSIEASSEPEVAEVEETFTIPEPPPIEVFELLKSSMSKIKFLHEKRRPSIIKKPESTENTEEDEDVTDEEESTVPLGSNRHRILKSKLEKIMKLKSPNSIPFIKRYIPKTPPIEPKSNETILGSAEKEESTNDDISLVSEEEYTIKNVKEKLESIFSKPLPLPGRSRKKSFKKKSFNENEMKLKHKALMQATLKSIKKDAKDEQLFNLVELMNTTEQNKNDSKQINDDIETNQNNLFLKVALKKIDSPYKA